ncbi:MAG: sensor histidine kinase [Chloroflexi bacterium]|nr:sensor histidine kinase [Chloroflexota bacterium]
MSTDDRRILRPLGLALPVAVWFLGVFANRPGGITADFLAVFTALLAGLAVVDMTAPGRNTALWRRLGWLAAELALCFFIVRVQGSLVRPALAYVLPVSQAFQTFGPKVGSAASLSSWAVYSFNVGLYAWPGRLHEFPNYLSFFLGFYIVGALMTWAAIQQAGQRQRIQALYQDLQAAYAELQALQEQARQTAVVQERNRLAREIHDTLAHYLTVVNLQLEAAEKLGPVKVDQALEQVRRARRLTVDCLQEVRRSVAALRSSDLEALSLPNALRKLVAEFSENTGLAITLQSDVGDDARLPPETSLTLYRAAQEGLTNVHKHARATSARIGLSQRNGNLELTVEDNGIGPEGANATSRTNVGTGLGLLGLRERVDLLDGEVKFGAGAAGGSLLRVILPSRTVGYDAANGS